MAHRPAELPRKLLMKPWKQPNATLVFKIKGVTAAQNDLFILNKLQGNLRILQWINKKEVFIDWD